MVRSGAAGGLEGSTTGSKRKVPTISREAHAKVSYKKLLAASFCSSKISLMKKFASEKKWKLIMKVGRVQGVFFSPKFRRNLIIFSAFGIFQLISESFEHQILFFRLGSEQPKKETGRANNSHFELEFE
jgi:hypothetical protein